MNRKGSIMFYAFMLGLLILVLSLALAPAVRDFTTGAMNTTVNDTLGLNCTTTSDIFIKATCITVDMSLFYFIGALILIAGAIVTAKYYFAGDFNE